jgi:3-oxoacyl-(acyl-carrier-protein) synthase
MQLAQGEEHAARNGKRVYAALVPASVAHAAVHGSLPQLTELKGRVVSPLLR